MGKLAPAEFTAWLNLDKIVGREDGAIPRKYRELIALAVACTTQCPYCIEAHVKDAKTAGASREEITEASLLAAALRAEERPHMAPWRSSFTIRSDASAICESLVEKVAALLPPVF